MKRRSDPAWLGFLLQLSLDTHVREDEFGEWLKQNLFALRLRFHGSGEPDSTQVEYTFQAAFWHAISAVIRTEVGNAEVASARALAWEFQLVFAVLPAENWQIGPASSAVLFLSQGAAHMYVALVTVSAALLKDANFIPPERSIGI